MDNSFDGRYGLALTIVNATVGLRFSELQSSENAHPRDEVEIHRLRERFEAIYAQREDLAHASPETLSAIISELGTEVRTIMKGANDAIAPFGQ